MTSEYVDSNDGIFGHKYAFEVHVFSNHSFYPVRTWYWRTLQGRHNGRDGVLNHRYIDGLLNRFVRRKLKKTSKLRVTGLCEGNSPVTGEFPAQRASNVENVYIWWRHHENETQIYMTLICWYSIMIHLHGEGRTKISPLFLNFRIYLTPKQPHSFICTSDLLLLNHSLG